MFIIVISLRPALLVIDNYADIFVNQLIYSYLNNTTNFRRLTSHITSCYTHKMAIVSRPRIM